MKKHFPAFATFAMIALLCVNAFAQEPRKGQGMTRKGVVPDCYTLENLDLSTAQKQAILKTDERYKGRILEKRHALMLKRLELQGLLRDPQAPEDAIHAKAGEMGTLREALQQEMMDYQIRIREILTPDQIRRWCTMMGEPMSQGGWMGDSRRR